MLGAYPDPSLSLSSRGVALFRASIMKSLRSHRRSERKSLDQLKRQ